MTVTVRHYRADDAPAVARLLSSHPDTPNPVVGGITADQLTDELRDRGTLVFLVAEEVDDDGSADIVATLGLFRSNGRRDLPERHALGDMFFVVPRLRRSSLTGRIFNEAIVWLFLNGFDVCRLTVNPANSAALTTYRRVGCISRDDARPGDDGNIELFNFLPKVWRLVRPHLEPDELHTFRTASFLGCVGGTSGDRLVGDTLERAGRRTVDCPLAVDDLRIHSTIDVDSDDILALTVGREGGMPRSIPLPPAAEPRRDPVTPVVVTRGPWALQVDPSTGRADLTRPDHVGPVWSICMPDPRPDRAGGWRQGAPRPLTVSLTADAEAIDVEDATTGLRCRYGIGHGFVSQRLTAPAGSTVRQFHVVGQRLGTFTATGADGTAWQDVPIGPGVGVRDSSEVVAAAAALADGRPVTWSDPQGRERLNVEAQGMRLVHSALLDHRIECGDSAVTTTIRFADPWPTVTPEPEIVPQPEAGRQSTAPVPTFDAAHAAVRTWREGSTRLLRTPHPRPVRPFGSNPTWRGGLWVTRERSRADAVHGLGWGAALDGWAPTPDGGLVHAGRGLEARIEPADDGWIVRVYSTSAAPDDAGEDVVWLTPAVSGAAVLGTATERWSDSIGQTWQRWTDTVWVRLDDGSELSIEPTTCSGPAAPEISVRQTSAGLLIGCVTRTAGAPTGWHVRRRIGSPTALDDVA